MQQARARAPAAPRARATTATLRSSAPRRHASRRIPSDMAVALAALDARCACRARAASARSRSSSFHRLPGDEPQRDTVLEHGELITAVDLPPLPFAARSRYRKVRDRASYAFALVSVAAALDVADGVVRDVRHRARRRRAQAVARDARRGTRCAARRRPRRRSARPRMPSSRRRGRCATTHSRSRWRATSSCARCSTSRRSAVDDRTTRAIGAPLDRIDGPLEGHRRGALRLRVPGRGRDLRLPVQSTDRARAGSRRSTPAPRARCRACSPCSRTRTRRAARRGRRRRLRVLQIGRGRLPRPVRRRRRRRDARRSRAHAASLRRRPLRASSAHDVDAARGPRRPLQAADKVNAGYATDTEEGDVDAALARGATSRSTRPTPRRTTTTTRSSRTRRSRSGATTALTLYDANQGAHSIRDDVAKAFGAPPERVRVISPYVGGGVRLQGVHPPARDPRRSWRRSSPGAR